MKKNYRLFEKGRDELEKEIDIANFIQQFRLLQRIVLLKLKLTYEEKTFVENNRFTKLQLSGPDSSDDDEDDGVSTPGRSPDHKPDMNRYDVPDH